jgi:hypothetical protein
MNGFLKKHTLIKMKIFSFLFYFLISLPCVAQVKLTKLDKKTIPASLQYTGNIVNAVRWTDNSGDHIVITTETGEVASKGDESSRDAAVYAWHYSIKQDSALLTWKMQDFVKECPVDIVAGFVRNSFGVTDLDKNGETEIWLMYKMVCRGDVSPVNMKIIMYETGKKYAVRGTNQVKVSEKDFTGGEYSFDEAFKKAPDVFRKYAEQLWKKNILEKWD